MAVYLTAAAGQVPTGARFTNIVDRPMYRQKFHCQIGEPDKNFVLPFQVSLILSRLAVSPNWLW